MDITRSLLTTIINAIDGLDGAVRPPPPSPILSARTISSETILPPQDVIQIPIIQEQSEDAYVASCTQSNDVENGTEQHEEQEANAVPDTHRDDLSEMWTPTKRNVSLGAETTSTSASVRVRRRQMKFSLGNGQKSASG